MAKMSQFEKSFVNCRSQYYFHKWFGFGKLLKKLPDVPYKNILEIGSGVGMTAELLAKKYGTARVLATDFDEQLIEMAKQKDHPTNVIFQQADAAKLPFADDTFDAAFAVLTLHHIQNFRGAISEVARVLKANGDFYIMDIPSDSFNFFHFRKSAALGLGIFSKRDLVTIGETYKLRMSDYGGKYLFSLRGQKR